ncbi:MAG: amino acid permease, partial [Egibacteraceae bacterium]
AVVAASALMAAGPEALAAADAPLAAAVTAGTLGQLAPVVRVGATVAALGVLLSLIVGISRTAFAMAGNGDLPRWFAAVHPRYAVPHRAEVAVAVLVAVTAALVDLRQAIGFSAFAVLTYYAVANAAAWTLTRAQRRWPRPVAAAGVAGCAVLAFSLPVESVVVGVGVLAVGALVWAVQQTRR